MARSERATNEVNAEQGVALNVVFNTLLTPLYGKSSDSNFLFMISSKQTPILVVTTVISSESAAALPAKSKTTVKKSLGHC